MWTPKDTATWLALIALILVIPFNFFSSWAYPKVQNWWAARSRKSLQRRIEKLTKELADMETGLSIRDEWVLLCAAQLGKLVYWSTNVIMLVVLFCTTPLLRSVIHHPKIFAFGISSTVLSYKLFTDYVMFRIEFFRRVAGPMKKMDLKLSIEELTTKLAARE